MFVSAFGAFLFQVKSISDYGMAFYASITGFAMANFFSLLISNSPIIRRLIIKFEKFIEKSESIRFQFQFKSICSEIQSKTILSN